jgi:hypothetical protein
LRVLVVARIPPATPAAPSRSPGALIAPCSYSSIQRMRFVWTSHGS